MKLKAVRKQLGVQMGIIYNVEDVNKIVVISLNIA